MARDFREKFTWEAATAAAPYDGDENGESFDKITEFLQPLAVQLKGPFTATVSIQAKLHPDFPFEEIASVTAPGITAITIPAERVKLVISGYAAGTVQAVLAGFNVQPG